MPCNTSIIFGQDRKSLEILVQKCLNDLDDFSFKQVVLHVLTTYKPELLRENPEKTSSSPEYKGYFN
jgi:hypothetical protein